MADVRALAAADRTTTTISEAFEWSTQRCCIVLNVEEEDNTPTLTPVLYAWDPLAGVAVAITSFASVSPSGATTYAFFVTPDTFLPSGGAIEESVQAILPTHMKAGVTHGDSDRAKYTLDVLECN